MEKKSEKTYEDKIHVSDESLSRIAIYLNGLKDGKGDLLPLGTHDLEQLWNAVKYLRGDFRFTASRDSKK